MWNILIFGAIPVLTVVIIFIKKKRLWTAPLISTALAFIAYIIAFAPITPVELFSNNEWRGFFILALLIHIVIVVVLTLILYFVSRILKQKQQKAN